MLTNHDSLEALRFEVFASYSHEDSDLVGTLVLILRAAGSGVFRDVDNIPPGSRWRAVIAGAIVHCDIFMLFWCCHSRESNAVASEIEQALSLGKRIVPILLDATPLSAMLSEYQWIDMRTALGRHGEVYTKKEVLPALPGRSFAIGYRTLHSELLAGGLYLWTELGKRFSAGK